MRSKSRSREADFRPFFDLIVGVVFIFLNLLSAQMFFMRHASMEASDSQAEKLELERKEQIKSFIEHVAEELQKRDLTSTVDLKRSELRMPMQQFAQSSPVAAPRFTNKSVEALGQVLSNHVNCLETPTSPNTNCPQWNLVKLSDAMIDVQTGKPPPELGLSAGRFGQLVTTIFSSALLSAQPQLLVPTNSAGLSLFQFGSLPSDLATNETEDLLRIKFRFQP